MPSLSKVPWSSVGTFPATCFNTIRSMSFNRSAAAQTVWPFAGLALVKATSMLSFRDFESEGDLSLAGALSYNAIAVRRRPPSPSVVSSSHVAPLVLDVACEAGLSVRGLLSRSMALATIAGLLVGKKVRESDQAPTFPPAVARTLQK